MKDLRGRVCPEALCCGILAARTCVLNPETPGNKRGEPMTDQGVPGAPSAGGERHEVQALALHAGEGMLTARGDRKRTAGGIFFHLAKQQATPKQHRRLQFWLGSDRQRPRRPMNAPPGPPPHPKATALQQAPQHKPASTLADSVAQAQRGPGAGTLSTTSVKLIGRPGTVQTQGALTRLVLTAE